MATPSEADSVKLLTVHRAKGLEWDAVFLIPGVTERKFPTDRTPLDLADRAVRDARSRCAATRATGPPWPATPRPTSPRS